MQIIKASYKTKDGFIKESTFSGPYQIDQEDFVGFTGIKITETELPEGTTFQSLGENNAKQSH